MQRPFCAGAVVFAFVFGLAGCHHNPPNVFPQVMSAKVDLSLCPSSIDVKSEKPLASSDDPPADGSCHPGEKDGYPVPDPNCTPGAINPTLTLTVLEDQDFKTGCVRDKATTPAKKDLTYGWYGIDKPQDNTGQNQVCEKDHLVPLYLGGADTLDNIWPQCGPDEATLNERYFKQKDRVELYLGKMVRAGKMPLKEAQRGIAENWTQYLNDANKWCSTNNCSGVTGVD